MATGRLDDLVAYVTLTGSAGSATGTAKLGPLSAREIWHPQSATVSVVPGTAFVNDAQCQIYVGDINNRRLRDSTLTGSTGDSSSMMSNDTVKAGAYIWAVWTNGDPVMHQLTISGSKDI